MPRQVFACSQCDYETHRKTFMEDHKRIHSGDRPFRCDECGKGFTQKSNLNKHMLVHGKGAQRSYKCEFCDFTTKYKQSLKMHENWHQGIKPFVCNVCGRSFSQSTHRRTHMQEAHSENRQFVCHVCSKTFKRKEHLERHLAYHANERDRECDICHKKFNDNRSLQVHLMVHGGDETKIHKCELCPYKTRYKQGLKVHYYMHLGVRPYQCDSCSKSFRTSQVLKIHQRMVHLGEAGRIFECDHCEYAAAHKQILKAHILRIHMKVKIDKKVRCPFCKKLYLSASSLHNHKTKKHPILTKKERLKKMKEKLDVLKKVRGIEKSTNLNIDDVDDYRYTVKRHTAKNMVKKAITRKHISAARRAEENDKDTPLSQIPMMTRMQFIHKCLKGSGIVEKDVSDRKRTNKPKFSKYRKFPDPRKKLDDELSTKPECGSEPEDLPDVEPWFEDNEIPSITVRKIGKDGKYVKVTEPFISNFRTTKSAIVPAGSRSPKKVKLTDLEDGTSDNPPLLSMSERIALETMNHETHNSWDPLCGTEMPPGPKGGRKPSKMLGTFYKRKSNTSNHEHSKRNCTKVIVQKPTESSDPLISSDIPPGPKGGTRRSKLLQKQYTCNTKVIVGKEIIPREELWNPRTKGKKVPKRKIIRREGHTIVWESDSPNESTHVPKKTPKRSAPPQVLSISERVANALPPVLSMSERIALETMNSETPPITDMWHNPEIKIEPTSNDKEYDSLRDLASQYAESQLLSIPESLSLATLEEVQAIQIEPDDIKQEPGLVQITDIKQEVLLDSIPVGNPGERLTASHLPKDPCDPVANRKRGTSKNNSATKTVQKCKTVVTQNLVTVKGENATSSLDLRTLGHAVPIKVETVEVFESEKD